ncbi:hypothetical protein [Pseudonocardia sp. GCM10023141]|uniref:hypothetical protein n=1 Tax=Pseudonocardia sp. GCM10023141 TaxID=3252653 RepID=UPI0036231F0A
MNDGWTALYRLRSVNNGVLDDFFIVAVNQVGGSSNFAHILDVQSRHISDLIAEAQRRGSRTIEAEKQAEDAWVDVVVESSQAGLEFQRSCTPGWMNNEGQPNIIARRNGQYGPGIVAFDRLIEAWRADGEYRGVVFSDAGTS